jgi:hypothetical protein
MSSADSPQVSRGLLVTLGVALGVGVLALLYLYVVQPLLGDAEEVAQTIPSPAATDPSPEPGESPEPEALDDEPVSETFEVFTARDPFQQLVVVPASQTGTGSPSPSPTGTASPTPTGTPTTPPDAVVGGTTIRLVDVFTDGGVEKILVTVNGTGYEVAQGETFADRFRVLDITGQCATLLFGDSRFTLCEGEQIRK